MSQGAIGILVRDAKYFDYVLNFTSAAFDKGYQVLIFFSGRGVLLTQEARFEHLIDLSTPYICEVSYRSHGLEGREISGVGFKQFVTQAKNAEMLEETERYLVF